MCIRDRYKDAILFFRLGDFYEMFFDDAILVSRELELTLTGKDCGLSERAPMCLSLIHISLVLQHADGLKDLWAGHAVFGVPRVAHAGVADVQLSAGVVAQADLFRDAAVLFEELYVGDVVQIDDGAQFARVPVKMCIRDSAYAAGEVDHEKVRAHGLVLSLIHIYGHALGKARHCRT